MRLNILLLISCSLFSLSAFSQLNGNYNYSISVTGYRIFQNPKIFEQDPQKYINSAASGAMIKINDNQISYRFSGSFLQKNVNFQNNCESCQLANGKITDYTFKIGFEKSFNYSWMQPYFAFDIGYRYNRFKGMMNTINNQQAISSVSQIADTKTGINIAPVLGIKLNPTERISIFAEANVELYLLHNRQETLAQNSSGSNNLNSFNKGTILINPVAIGIQYHLGNKN